MSAKEQKQELFNKLDSISDVLRKTMDASEYRNYILGFIFYKFLSEKWIKNANELLEADGITYDQIGNNTELSKSLKETIEERLGYYIDEQHLFKSWINKIDNNEDILSLIEDSLRYIENSAMGKDSEDDFRGLFSDIDLNSNKLGNSNKEKEKAISHVLKKLNEIKFELDDHKIDILGDAYEHMIANFASAAGKKAGEFYTPQEVSKILAKIVTHNRKRLKNAYDPTCGSGSLILQVAQCSEVGTLYGQEVKQTTFNLARMNMFLRGKDYHSFKIANADTIMEPKNLEDNNGTPIKFDAIVANPPFSLPWDAPETMLSDPRFSDYGRLAPKSKMDYAFIQHMLYHLADDGIMATVVPHGVLFRGAAEGEIRKFIINNMNAIDGVIGLPSNIFYGTSIPSCILVLKKNRKSNDKIIFIEASREFEKGKNQNHLSDANINKILDTYNNKVEVEKYSKLVSLDEIKEKEYNLNITRYVDTFEEEEEIDIVAVNAELKLINEEIAKTEKEIEAMIAELVGKE